MLVEIAVLSNTAVVRVLREGHVGHLFQTSNAHDTGGLNASLVRHKRGVQDMHSPRVEDRSARGLCHIDGGSLT